MLLGRAGFLLKLFQTLLVGSRFLARVLESGLLSGETSTLVAESTVSDKTLDLRGLVSLVTVVLELSANNELRHVIRLRQTKQLTDVTGSLRAQTTRNRRSFVRQTGNLLLTLLHDHQVQNADVGTDNTPTNRLALPFALPITTSAHAYITTSSVAGHTVSQKETHAVVAQNALLHGETLLVVSSSDATTSNHNQNHTGRRSP